MSSYRTIRPANMLSCPCMHDQDESDNPLAWLGSFRETISETSSTGSKMFMDYATRGQIFTMKGIRESDCMNMTEQAKESLLQEILRLPDTLSLYSS